MPSLREIRETAGLSQEAAGAGINVCGSAISRWERSEREPSDFREVQRLAEYYISVSRNRADKVARLAKEKGLVGEP
jgi:transcriptional regulator with XRE-family HTH domain